MLPQPLRVAILAWILYVAGVPNTMNLICILLWSCFHKHVVGVEWWQCISTSLFVFCHHCCSHYVPFIQFGPCLSPTISNLIWTWEWQLCPQEQLQVTAERTNLFVLILVTLVHQNKVPPLTISVRMSIVDSPCQLVSDTLCTLSIMIAFADKIHSITCCHLFCLMLQPQFHVVLVHKVEMPVEDMLCKFMSWINELEALGIQ